ncbi:MAG: hypothetical protein ACRDHZ_24770 [Ktedonobacteraceae bacterium]
MDTVPLKLSLKGLQLATEYQLQRHIRRIKFTYNRLRVTPAEVGKEINDLSDALIEVRQEIENW